MVLKRKQNVSYIRQILEGNSFWLNCMHISTNDIQRYAMTAPKQRSIMYFYLGLSLSKILELSSGYLLIIDYFSSLIFIINIMIILIIMIIITIIYLF